MTADPTPTPEQPRCQARAGWCEKPAGHEGDHYTTYRPGETWWEARPEQDEAVRREALLRMDIALTALDWLDVMVEQDHPDLGITECLCDCHGHFEAGAVPAAPPLDVERLAAALDVLSEDGLEYDLMAPEEREDRDDAAERLAAEYDRLSPDQEEAPDD